MATVDLYNMRGFIDLTAKAAQAGIDAAIVPLHAQIQETLSKQGSRGSPSVPGAPPRNITGALRNSWQIGTPRHDLTARATSSNRLAGWIQTGGHVRPKNGKLLEFPVHPAAQRYFDKNSSIPGQPSDRLRVGLVVMRLVMQKVLRRVKTKNGLMWVKDVGGKHARGEIWFIGVPSVDIAPHPYVNRSIEASKKRCQTAFNSVFRSVFNATAPGGVR